MRLLALSLTLMAVLVFPCAASASGHYAKWQQRHPYHNPYLYPGRAVYAGSRYGFYGYKRPYTGVNQPVPFSMKHTAPKVFGPPDFSYAPQPERYIEGSAIPASD